MPEELEVQALKELGLPADWQYRDLPKMTQEFYDQLLAKLGEGEYHLVVTNTYPHSEHGHTIRSQMFVSPQGFKNLAKAHGL